MNYWFYLTFAGIGVASANFQHQTDSEEILISELKYTNPSYTDETFCQNGKCVKIRIKYDVNQNILSITIGRKYLDVSKFGISRMMNPSLKVAVLDHNNYVIKLQYGETKDCKDKIFTRDNISLIFAKKAYVEHLRYENCKLVPI